MVGTRLFIGGLTPDLEEASLKQQLSNYGQVLNIDVKDKKDIITGEVVKRFAFATLDGSHADVEKCIYSLNGSTLCGGTISVERAQESFIERLKREREARAAGKPLPRQDNNSGTNFASSYANKENDYGGDYSYSYRDNSANFSGYENDSWSHNRSHHNDNRWSGYDNSTVDDKPTATKDDVNGDLMPSLASFSSAWRDDDDGPDQKYDQHEPRTDKGPSTASSQRAPKLINMRRYDPTKSAQQAQATDADDATADANEEQNKVTPAVCITKDLVFSGASGTFSLLDMLEGKLDSSKAAEEKDDTDEKMKTDDVPMEAALSAPEASEGPKSVVEATPKKQKSPRKSSSETVTKTKTRKPYVKKHKFFIDAEDACVKDGVAWLYKEISGETQDEFRAARPSITSLYTTRQRRAATDRSDKSITTQSRDWWWSGGEGDDETSVEPATLASEVLSGVASAVRSSFAEERKSKDGVPPARHAPRGRGRGLTRGRGLPWGGRGSYRGRGVGRGRGGSNERG